MNGANGNSKLMRHVCGRFTTYTLTVFAIAASLPLIIEHGDIVVFNENGPIEWLQFAVLSISATVLLLDSRLEENTRQLFRIIASFALLAVIRELDLILDTFIPVAGWKLPFGLCAASAGTFYWKNKDTITSEVRKFICTRAFSLLWCGFIVAVPFGQLIGHGKFLQLLMGDEYVRDYKRVIQELAELMGYLLIMIGSIEAILQQKED